MQQFKELGDFLWIYLSAKSDGAKVHVRNVLIHMAIALLAMVIIAGLSVMGVWFLASGVAEGFGTLLGERPWAGKLVAGVLLITSLWVGTRLVVASFTKAAFDATVAKFDHQKSRQANHHAHSVADQPETPQAN